MTSTSGVSVFLVQIDTVTYNRALFLLQRVQMMQIWADYLDGLRNRNTSAVLKKVMALPFVQASANQNFLYVPMKA